MNYLDLFHGIGGFALGAYWAGMKFENHFCSDIEPYAQELYKLRFPDSIQLGDITKIKSEDLPDGEWIITGGFPCQDISIAGSGAGIMGNRSGLWFEYWRIIRDLRPRFAIMENVGAITFRGLDRVLGSLSEIGYNAEWEMLQACQFGMPHRRDRMWIIAYPESIYDIWSNNEKNRWEVEWCKKLGRCGKRSPIPEIVRVDDGIPEQLDESKGLGNAIVPQIAELLFYRIKYLLESEPRKASQN